MSSTNMTSPVKRARKPNRSTEEIAAEKKDKEEKKLAKQLTKEQKNTEKVAKKAVKEQKQATKAAEKEEKQLVKKQKAADKDTEKALKQLARTKKTLTKLLEKQQKPKRTRKPNRPKEVLDTEKAAKAERKLAKKQKQTEVNLPNGDMWVNVANCYKLTNQRHLNEETREEFQDKITELGGTEAIETTGIMTTVYENLRPGETMNFDEVYQGSTNIHKDKIQKQFRENESYINGLVAEGSGLTTQGTETLKRLRRENHALTTQLT